MAIKSFQGRRNQPKKEELKPALVSDYMTTNLITFKPNQPVSEVVESLIQNRISGGPVVNDKHMIKKVDTIDGNMNIFEAAEKFLKAKHRRFPIIENGKLVGQISQKDILIASLEQKAENWK